MNDLQEKTLLHSVTKLHKVKKVTPDLRCLVDPQERLILSELQVSRVHLHKWKHREEVRQEEKTINQEHQGILNLGLTPLIMHHLEGLNLSSRAGRSKLNRNDPSRSNEQLHLMSELDRHIIEAHLVTRRLQGVLVEVEVHQADHQDQEVEDKR